MQLSDNLLGKSRSFGLTLYYAYLLFWLFSILVLRVELWF